MIKRSRYLVDQLVDTNQFVHGDSVDLSRRRFVQGAVAGGSLAVSGLAASSVFAAGASTQPQVLSGNRFKLSFDYQKVNFTGKDRIATAINGSVPAPVLRWKQGERVTLDVTNNMAVDSSIHRSHSSGSRPPK